MAGHRVKFFVFEPGSHRKGAHVNLCVEDDGKGTPPFVLGIRKLRSLCSSSAGDVRFLLLEPQGDDNVSAPSAEAEAVAA